MEKDAELLLEFARTLKQKFVEVFSVLASSTVNSKPEEGIMTDTWFHFTACHLKRSFRFHFMQLQAVSFVFLLLASFASSYPGTSTFFLCQNPWHIRNGKFMGTIKYMELQ